MNNYEKLRSICKTANVSNISDEYLFTLNCVDYFYYYKNIGEIDIKDCFVDGPNDGGIDYIYADEDSIYLIQGKTSDKLSYNDFRDIFSKLKETYENLNNKRYGTYSNNLTQSFINIYDSFNNEPKINFVLYTKTSISNELSKKIDDNIINSPNYMDYSIQVYDNDSIESKIASIDAGASTVLEDVLTLDKANNCLWNGKKAAVFSIKASSLQKLYKKYSNNGLFGYNLREHITDKKVDHNIDNTINTDKDNFWFLNNGITIGCKDFHIDGDKLKMYNFSIINGAQTTYKIGNSKKISNDYDFILVCKVIKSEKSLDDSFIRNISEASNSQKPIRFRDLKANSSEQVLMQQKSANNKYPLAIEIKRGVKPGNYKSVNNPWQRISNEYLGQLILACDYQKPGSARSKKADIFGNDRVYNSLFSMNKIKNYNYNTLYDLVRLSHSYDDFKIRHSKEIDISINSETNQNILESLNEENIMLQNAKFTVLALVMFFYKIKYMNLKSTDSKIYEQNLNSNLTLDYHKDDYDEKLDYLFGFLVSKLSDLYKRIKIDKNLTSQSNFLKLDSNYTDIIIPEFNKLINDKYDSEKILDNLKIFEKS